MGLEILRGARPPRPGRRSRQPRRPRPRGRSAFGCGPGRGLVSMGLTRASWADSRALLRRGSEAPVASSSPGRVWRIGSPPGGAPRVLVYAGGAKIKPRRRSGAVQSMRGLAAIRAAPRPSWRRTRKAAAGAALRRKASMRRPHLRAGRGSLPSEVRRRGPSTGATSRSDARRSTCSPWGASPG